MTLTSGEDDFGVRFLCPEGYINDVATTFFSSPDQAIGWMLSMGEHSWGQPYGFTPFGLAVCTASYLVMMIAAFGRAGGPLIMTSSRFNPPPPRFNPDSTPSQAASPLTTNVSSDCINATCEPRSGP